MIPMVQRIAPSHKPGKAARPPASEKRYATAALASASLIRGYNVILKKTGISMLMIALWQMIFGKLVLALGGLCFEAARYHLCSLGSSPSGRLKVKRIGFFTNSSAARSTLPLGIVNGSATTNAADPATTASKPRGRVTTRSTNMSEPEGAAVWASNGGDAIVSTITHPHIQRLARFVMKVPAQAFGELRILVNREDEVEGFYRGACGSIGAAKERKIRAGSWRGQGRRR